MSYETEAILNKVIEAIREQLDTEAEVSADKLLKEDLALPSIKMVMILTTLTAELGISILDFTDYELLRLKTVGDVAGLLCGKLNPTIQNEINIITNK
jgi:acyl carrier protein